MKKYIEQEAAKTCTCSLCRWEGTSNCEECEHPIDDIPTVNVHEAKKGHWAKAHGSWCTPGGDPVWECSECGKGRHVYGIEHGTYGADVAEGQWVSCPNCGAYMGENA